MEQLANAADTNAADANAPVAPDVSQSVSSPLTENEDLFATNRNISFGAISTPIMNSGVAVNRAPALGPTNVILSHDSLAGEEHYQTAVELPQFLKLFNPDINFTSTDLVLSTLRGQLCNQAMLELAATSDDYQRYRSGGIEYFTLLAMTDPSRFCNISIAAIQEEALRNFDFSLLSLYAQLGLIQNLTSKDLRHLALRHCDALSDDNLKLILGSLLNLTSFLISKSPINLQPGGLQRAGVLSLLSSKCLALVALSLVELPNFEGFKSGGTSKLFFPSLRQLKVKNCAHLQEITCVAPQLVVSSDLSYSTYTGGIGALNITQIVTLTIFTVCECAVDCLPSQYWKYPCLCSWK